MEALRADRAIHANGQDAFPLGKWQTDFANHHAKRE